MKGSDVCKEEKKMKRPGLGVTTHGVSYSASVQRVPTMCRMLFPGSHD